MKKNKWFLEKFLPSFKIGETKITEKQFAIFQKYLIENDGMGSDGYALEYYGYIEGYKITAYEFDCYGKYYERIVIIKPDNNSNKELYKKFRIDL